MEKYSINDPMIKKGIGLTEKEVLRMCAAMEEHREQKDRTPPFQPILHARTIDSVERVIKWHPAGLKREALFYQFQSGDDPGKNKVAILPDACINILFECCPDNPKATLSGIHLKAREVQLKPNTTYFGFKPYSDRGINLNRIPLPELVDDSVDFLELCPGAAKLLSQLAGTADFDTQISLFDAFAKQHLIEQAYQPSFVDFFTLLLCSSKGTGDLEELQNMIGYSKRYCRERFKADHGISPKRYSNIMRFQRTLKQLVRAKSGELTSLATNNGYFDQAHFIHDFKGFTNQAPSRFCRDFFGLDANREAS